jgi:hypothetical protein
MNTFLHSLRFSENNQWGCFWTNDHNEFSSGRDSDQCALEFSSQEDAQSTSEMLNNMTMSNPDLAHELFESMRQMMS